MSEQWYWTRQGGELILATLGKGMKTILAADDDRIVTRDPIKGLLREIDPTDNVARLIAAAPELLEALKGLCEADRDDLNDSASAVWNAAVAAIAKAEGRS